MSPQAVTYELFYSAGRADADRAAKAAALERRVAGLERLLGAGAGGDAPGNAGTDENGANGAGGANGAAAGVAGTGSATLLGAVAALEAKAALFLDPARVDAAAVRARAAAADLARLRAARGKAKAKDGGGSADTDAARAAKLDALWAVAERWDGVAASLPALVARLRALRALHEAGATFAGRLSRLEDAQEGVDRMLGEDLAALARVEEGAAANAAAMRDNVAALDAKFAAVMGGK